MVGTTASAAGNPTGMRRNGAILPMVLLPLAAIASVLASSFRVDLLPRRLQFYTKTISDPIDKGEVADDRAGVVNGAVVEAVGPETVDVRSRDPRRRGVPPAGRCRSHTG